MAKSSSLLLLILYVGRWFSTAASVDCAESVHGTLTLLSRREGDGETVVSTVKLPATTEHATGQSFVGGDLTTNFVSNVQHLRTITNSEYTVSLLDGSVIVVFKNSTVVSLTLDAEDCVPYQLFQHAPNSSAFVMCSKESGVLEMKVTPAGFVLKKTALQAQMGQKYLNVPAVPLYHPDPDLQTSAVFLHFGTTSDGQDKTWLTLVRNIETGINNHENIICDDTFDDGREECYTKFTRIVPFNDTHFVLECRETSESDAVRFLVDAFFKYDCEGIGALDVPDGGELYVGPDRDTLAVNLGDRVSVYTNNFTQSYHCVVTQGLVDRVDFGTTADNDVLLLLFITDSIFTCNSFGEIELLSSSPLLDGPFPYFIDGHHIFVTQEGESADFYSVRLFDVQEGCEVQYPNAGPIYTDKRPVLYLFSPEVDDPTTTQPPTEPSIDQVTPTSVTPSSSLAIQSSPGASDNTVVIVVPILAFAILIILLIAFIIATVICCNRSRKSWFWELRGRVRALSDSLSNSSAASDIPVAETQGPSPVRYAIPATDDSPYNVRHLVPDTLQFHPSMKPPIPESGGALDMCLPIQAVRDKLNIPQTNAQIV